MKKHSLSFFISIFIHLFLAVLVLFVYKKVHTKEPLIKEHKISINLTTLQTKKVERKSLHKEVIKKPYKSEKKSQVTKKKIPIKHKIQKQPKKKVEPRKKVLHKIVKKQERKYEKKSLHVQSHQVKTKEKINKKEMQNLQPLPPVKTLQEEYIEEHLLTIQKLIRENLYYPRRARKKGIEGRVALSFTILEDGSVQKIKIRESDYDILSRAAQRTIEELSGRFPKPKEPLKVSLPIMYNLKR